MLIFAILKGTLSPFLACFRKHVSDNRYLEAKQKNGFILWSSNGEMITTHQEVRMAIDGENGNGLRYGFLKKRSAGFSFS